jgi:hypothetical protein
MRKELVSKILVLGIICLFIGVGIQPALAVEPKVSTNPIEKVEVCDCQEVDKLNPVRVKLLFTQLKIRTNILLKKFGHIPEVKENCNDIFKIINSYNPLANGEIICSILVGIYLAILSIYWSIRELQEEVGGLIAALLYFPLLPIAAIGLAFEWFVYLFCEEFLPDTTYEINQIIPNGFLTGSY